MDYIIRRATGADYEALCVVLDEIDALHRDAVPRVYRHPGGPAREREYIDGLLADPAVALFLAECAGEPAGMVHAVVHDTPPVPILVPRRLAVVDTLAVRQAFRRGGIGRALMAEAERWARAQGAVDIELTVYEFNRGARAFYRALGYKTTTRRLSKLLP